MARYFFHIMNDIDVVDEEGQELPSLAAARHQALAYARDLASQSVKEGAVNLNHRIVVEDEDHEQLLAVTFREAFTITY